MSKQELTPPDSHHLSAAIGWLELGNPQEAAEEMARISKENRDHPDVLEVRMDICSVQKDWEKGLLIAEKLVATAPDRSSGWIQKAYCLRRVEKGGLPLAWEVLQTAFKKFPAVFLIAYNLACYAAQFGRLDEAWDWLHKAMEISGKIDAIKEMALADSDLEALWDRIREI